MGGFTSALRELWDNKSKIQKTPSTTLGTGLERTRKRNKAARTQLDARNLQILLLPTRHRPARAPNHSRMLEARGPRRSYSKVLVV